MKILENYNLVKNNTFGINSIANTFIEYYNDDDILNFIRENPHILKSDFLLLGEGSNILFSGDYNGIVIHSATKDIKIISEDDSHLFIEASAGLVFCDFIEWCIKNGAYGLENLSYIPGTVGASAVQNVGAYGAEAGNLIYKVKYYNIASQEVETINNHECKFDYRNSIFKNKLKNKTVILTVTYCLNKKFRANLSYSDVKNYFYTTNENDLTADSLRTAIKNIRDCKLPNTKLIGSAGSFFKNPVIDIKELENLKLKFPDIKYFSHNSGKIKIAAGWLIDNCGLKGFEHNGAAVYDKQALILINKNNATGKDIIELSDIVKKQVFDKFGINLEPEVIIV